MPPASADDTVTQFLQYFNAHDTANLMNLLCPDQPAGAPNIPSVGLAHDGPQFKGRVNVQTLFQQLFLSFQDISINPLGGLARLYSDDGRIAFQARIRGIQIAPWFDSTSKLYSPPISDVVPDGMHSMEVPACPIFAIDAATCLITNWTIYFDRYRMWRQLQPDQLSAPSFANTLVALARALTARRST